MPSTPTPQARVCGRGAIAAALALSLTLGAAGGDAAGSRVHRAVPETPKVAIAVLHRSGPSGDGPVLVLRTAQVKRSRGDRVQVFERPGHTQELIAAHRVGHQRWKLSPSSPAASALLRRLRDRVEGGRTARVKTAVVTGLPIGSKVSRFEIDAFDLPIEAL